VGFADDLVDESERVLGALAEADQRDVGSLSGGHHTDVLDFDLASDHLVAKRSHDRRNEREATLALVGDQNTEVISLASGRSHRRILNPRHIARPDKTRQSVRLGLARRASLEAREFSWPTAGSTTGKRPSRGTVLTVFRPPFPGFFKRHLGASRRMPDTNEPPAAERATVTDKSATEGAVREPKSGSTDDDRDPRETRKMTSNLNEFLHGSAPRRRPPL
jgi:hypothetical protein